ncbi:Uncharacterised protein [Segatella copri]|nr:Uncharacterised protein [Segatella copri]
MVSSLENKVGFCQANERTTSLLLSTDSFTSDADAIRSDALKPSRYILSPLSSQLTRAVSAQRSIIRFLNIFFILLSY